MKIIAVLRDELKRCSWLLMVVLACLLVDALELSRGLNNVFQDMILYDISMDFYTLSGLMEENITMYLIPMVLIALCQVHRQEEEFWYSLPYTRGELYGCRVLFGILCSVAITLGHYLIYLGITGANRGLLENCYLLGVDTTSLYTPFRLFITLMGTYTVASLVFILINRPVTALWGLAFVALLPELIIAPLSWFGINTDTPARMSEIKYLVAMGGQIPPAYSNLLTVGLPIYAALTAILIFVGYLLAKGKPLGKTFYNKGVKVVYLILWGIFVLNVIDLIFVQGGLI